MTERQKVTLAYVHPNELAVSFHDSVINLIGHDAVTNRYLADHDAGRITVRCGTSDGLSKARNTVVAQFLQTDSDWLLWVDSDMGLASDTLNQLMAVAHPTGRPVVGALCFASREITPDGMGGFRTWPQPVIFDWTDLGDGYMRFVGRTIYPPASVVECAATGSACILIHRSVFEKTGKDGWYDRIRGTDGMLLGEDVSFCARVGAAGLPVAVHTGVKTTHLKPQWVAEADYWQRYLAPPATDPTAVVVPILGRPQHAEPFMMSLRASTGLAKVYAVCDASEGEAVDAWRKAGAVTIIRQFRGKSSLPGSFAEKVNAGARQTTEPWVFVAGSDVKFYPGWLDHAQHMAATFGADVVGTNDLGNPRVIAGEHGTHLLIRRSYIEERGASWDGPGVVCHEGYRHWFVDDEIVAVAKQRRTWISALGSVVEHLHPLFGKGEDDDVYRLGQQTRDADGKLFEARLADHAE